MNYCNKNLGIYQCFIYIFYQNHYWIWIIICNSIILLLFDFSIILIGKHISNNYFFISSPKIFYFILLVNTHITWYFLSFWHFLSLMFFFFLYSHNFINLLLLQYHYYILNFLMIQIDTLKIFKLNIIHILNCFFVQWFNVLIELNNPISILNLVFVFKIFSITFFSSIIYNIHMTCFYI